MPERKEYKNPFNPYVCPIYGDLSRADVVALTLLCRGKNVVEYGVGGSTIILSQIAKSVVSFDTKEIWVERTKEFLKQIPNKTCEPEFRPILKEKFNGSSVKGIGFPCDIVFSDGWAAMRGHFILEFWKHISECAIAHDSRAIYAGNIVKMFMNAYDNDFKNDSDDGQYVKYVANRAGLFDKVVNLIFHYYVAYLTNKSRPIFTRIKLDLQPVCCS